MPSSQACTGVIDCNGLRELASMQSGSSKTALLDALSAGKLGVPVCVWNEFQDAFADEAATIAAHVSYKIQMKQRYRAGAGSIAANSNAHFSYSPYDDHTDFFVAAISQGDQLTLVTTVSEVASYQHMGCTAVSDLAAWAAQL